MLLPWEEGYEESISSSVPNNDLWESEPNVYVTLEELKANEPEYDELLDDYYLDQGYTKHSATIVHQTAKAILLKDIKGNFWVPKSICEELNGSFFIEEGFNIKYIPEDIIKPVLADDIKF